MILLAAALVCLATAETPPAPAPVAAADSSAVAAPPGTLPAAVAAAPPAAAPDSLVAQLDRLAVARDRLGETDRRVLDELIAAAWQMIEDGDWEAAALIAADARRWTAEPRR